MSTPSFPVKSPRYSGLIWEFGPLLASVLLLFVVWAPTTILSFLALLFGGAAVTVFIYDCYLPFSGAAVYAIMGVRRARGWYKVTPILAVPFLICAAILLVMYFMYRNIGDLNFDALQY